MKKVIRVKFEMLMRVSHFGIANRELFPEESASGKKFTLLSGLVKAIEAQFLRQSQARTEARKVKLETKRTAREFLKAMASAGRRAAAGESAPHPFRLPYQRSATVLVTTARYFAAEAERRKERFAEVGLAPTFLADYEKAVGDLAAAIDRRQESRGARSHAQGAIEEAMDRAMDVLSDLDVAVKTQLRGDRARLAEWLAIRRVDRVGGSGAQVQASTAPTSPTSVAAGPTALPTPPLAVTEAVTSPAPSPVTAPEPPEKASTNVA